MSAVEARAHLCRAHCPNCGEVRALRRDTGVCWPCQGAVDRVAEQAARWAGTAAFERRLAEGGWSS